MRWRNTQITACSWLLIPTRCCERITISKNLATLMNANPASFDGLGQVRGYWRQKPTE
jgi:hypothetical protein